MTNREQIQKLIKHYQRRLQKLREQQALSGLKTDPAVLIEIEDIEEILDKLMTAKLAETDVSDQIEQFWDEMAEDKTPTRQTDTPANVINISSNSGQIVFGENNHQFGDISGGQVIVGSNQIYSADQSDAPVDLASVRRMLVQLQTQIEGGVPPEKKPAALERIVELEEAITGAKPDLDTIVYVNRWFSKNIPTLAKAVANLIEHPTVSKLMAAADDSIATEFRRRFG